MNDKDEMLAAIATLGTRVKSDLDALGTRLETRLDVMAKASAALRRTSRSCGSTLPHTA
jgi:hypothetical protein